MSIRLELRRVTPQIYRRLAAMEEAWEFTAEETRIDGGWDILTRVLAAFPFDNGETLARAVNGVDQLAGVEDYGGTRGVPTQETARIAAALDAVDEEDFRRRFFDSDLTGAYGLGNKNDESADVAVRRFGYLREFYRGASEAGDAVIKWLV